MLEEDLRKIIIEKTKAKSFAKAMSPYKKELFEITGLTDLSHAMYVFMNGNLIPHCSVCGKDTKFKNYFMGYSKTCSVKCASKLGGEMNKKSYNIESYYKSRATLKANYGVTSPLAIPSSKRKFKATSVKKFGVSHPMQNPIVANKVIDTNNIKYGVDHYFQTDSMKLASSERITANHNAGFFKTYFNNLGVNSWYETDEYFDLKIGNVDSLLDGRRLDQIAHDNNISVYTLKRYLKVKNIDYKEPYHTSGAEVKIMNLLNEHSIEFSHQDRNVISPLELDFYVPAHNIAIEINGIYYHSELFKEKVYHRTKFELCKQLGITLIQITDLDLQNKNQQYSDLILSKLNIGEKCYARQCKIVVLSGSEASKFTALNHIQGHVNASVYLGLKHNDKLVAMMSFRKSRFNSNYDWELMRFCSKGRVVGGFSKLLSHFQRNNSGSIMSYSNSNLSIGDVYTKTGFTYKGHTGESYVWTNSKEIKSRYSVMKKKLGYATTENDYMRGLGYYKYYDAGNELWVI